MQGKIIKGIAGFYYVHVENMGTYECKAKGIFRNKSIKPLVGDNVEIDIIDDKGKKGNISQILKRENSLIRPAVANVEQAMIVFALTNPEPNLNLLDRFLVMMEFQNIDTIICFNKTDLGDEEFANKLVQIYSAAGYRIVFTSTTQNENIDTIAELLEGKTTVLAGPSGVGKSSMLNALAYEEKMETGTVSEKIGRGRHTTRHSEIFPIGHSTYVIDTPGFTSLDVPGMDETVLEECMPEFHEYLGKCKYTGCAHINEPACAIKDALEHKLISRERYDNYGAFYHELKNRRRY